jgi:hypothetical protein
LGTHLLSPALRCAPALLAMASACAHTASGPPPAPRVVSATRSYLLEKPLGLTGLDKHVSNDLWCAGDQAFSLPIVPFPEGPTELYGEYIDGGVTSTLDMLDANDSVVEVARTKIRPDLSPEDVLPGVASKLEHGSRVIPSLRFEWIQQRGRTQIQAVNPMEDYGGRQDTVYLSLSRGTSYDPKGPCRVDRHFVGNGYYFQIIAVAKPAKASASTPARDSCAFALELAAWAAENICLGAACCGGAKQETARAPQAK